MSNAICHDAQQLALVLALHLTGLPSHFFSKLVGSILANSTETICFILLIVDTPKTTTEGYYGWANEPPFRSWPVDEPNWDDTTTLWQPEPERRKMRTFVVTDPQEVPLECADIRRKLQANGSDASVVCVQFSRPSLGSPLLEYTVHVTTAFKGDYSPGVQFPSSFREPEDDVLVYGEYLPLLEPE